MSIVGLRKQWGALVVFGVSGCALAACSSPAASTTSTTRLGTGFVAVTTRPPPTAAQASRLVKEGCSSLAGLPAAVAGAAVTFAHDPSRALLALSHGPWYESVGMSGAGNDPAFAHVAADAKTLDLATLTSLRHGDASGVTASVTRLTRDCRVLKEPIG